ncbi:hypothetical protein L6164_030676 [Bauhinia variegata]|uniref:Uncharacterized protein n=1 Tax=Bauhinia variegata TaxID=167791 RepID=A0ACB9LDI8_BAUVA|nr:hypothetical protein L6164_030676 [Bauhinia variegata]
MLNQGNSLQQEGINLLRPELSLTTMKKTGRRSKQSSPIDVSASATNEKQLYEERIHQLEKENRAYQAEIEELRQNHGNGSPASDIGLAKLKEEYLQKLNVLEEQVTELKKKLASQSQFSTQRKRVDETTKQLQFEIQSLKAQKVQLQCKIKLESMQFRLCKASLEKEVLQLKKEARRKDYEILKLKASNQRFKMVLRRKTEEASTATERLRKMIEFRNAISSRSPGSGNGNNGVIQAAENELEVTTQLHELCSQYESEMERMAEEIAKLREEAEMQRHEELRSQLQEKDGDCWEAEFDINDLKEQVNGLGCLLRELQLQKRVNSSDQMQRDPVQPVLRGASTNKLLEKLKTPKTTRFSESKVERETAEGVCCSCSKKSLCKTTKCKCRLIGESCGKSCGCTSFKCTNREQVPVAAGESSNSENTKCTANASPLVDGTENGNIVASEGAKLLQSALVEKPADSRDNLGPRKKALRDIQNSLGNMDDKKPGKKKKGRKPVIHLVTKEPYSSLPENSNLNEAETQANNLMNLDNASLGMPLTDGNSGQPNEAAIDISEAAVPRNLRNPTRRAKGLIGKENSFISFN